MTIQTLLTDLGLFATAGKVAVPAETFAVFAERCVKAGAPLVLMYATDDSMTRGVFVVHAVFSASDGFLTLTSDLPADEPSYPSLTRRIMAAHWYERLMYDQFGIVAEGHPDWRRLIHHENIPEKTHPMRKGFDWNTTLPRAAVPYPMRAVEGKGVYEISVGPIYTDIIESGHFRFSVRGERIITLEGKLFFKHKGVEKLLEGKTPAEALPFIERISGDMVVGHTLAFVEAVERATGMTVSERAKYLRVFWGELERLTMHVFDISNIGGSGAGFSFLAAQGFRMVEELRRLNASLVGHRFLRGAIMLGGAHNVDEEAKKNILKTLGRIEREMKKILKVANTSDGLRERLETTGVLSREAAEAYGARGVAARASGVGRDFRRDHPYAAYKELPAEVMIEKAGDVAARFAIRTREITESLRLIRRCLAELPSGAVPGMKASSMSGEALGWVESWRGAIIDWVRIDARGRINRCVISDPSFCNWPLFGELAPGNILPDFPLCNKSLDLSCSGNDL